MSYASITEKVVNPCANYINKNWVRSYSANAFKKHIVGRCAYVALAPLSLVTNFFDTLVGIGFGIVSIGSLGQRKRINYLAFNHIKRSARIVADVYHYVLLGINPQFFPEYRAKIGPSRDGFLSQKTVNRWLVKVKIMSKSKKFNERHVASRLLAASVIPVSIVTRALDGLIATFVVPLSLVTGGTRRFPSLHNLADSTAQAPGVLYVLFFCALLTVNPYYAH